MSSNKVMVNGVIRDMTAEEISEFNDLQTAYANGALARGLKKLREIRLKFLAETDYLALGDLTMSSDMTTYRQALRDLTNGLDTVEKVNTKLELNVDENEKEIQGSYKNFPTKP
tara:strand:- start:59 stop:400 length:342 start_codon:yes stop_codon:yes gene_type:complete